MASFDNNIFQKEYSKEDDQEKTRTIGLELETYISNNECQLYSANRDPVSIKTDVEKIQDIAPIAAAGFDGDELELVTHPDSITLYQQGGSTRLKKVMKFLKENAADPLKLEKSGTHVNIGKLDTDDQNYIMDNAYWIMMNFAIQLQKIAGRVTSWAMFCQYNGNDKYVTDITPVSNKERLFHVATKKPNEVKQMPKLGLKEQSIVKKTFTYEFRLFRATNSLQEVLAWAELCHNIIQLANGLKPTEEITFKDLVRGKYIGKYVKQLKGERKLTELEIKATIKGTLSFQYYSARGTTLLK